MAKTKDPLVLTGYNMKLKKKDDPITNATIKKTETGKYFAKGEGSDGTTVCIAMGEERAKALVKAGVAKKEGTWK